MDKQKIEEAARRLQVEIWRRRESLWHRRDVHPFEALDPRVAARVLGIKLDFLPRLRFDVEDVRYETAGLLNRDQRVILVSTRFGEQVTRFTAAHELGHWEIHPNELRLHRDLPVKGLERDVRDPIEREADHFSACFLMPRRLVTKLFHDMFLTKGKQFVFNETTLYNLGTNESDALLYPESDSYDRELALARARSFGRRRFEKSLSEMFQVSPASMAIRIRELELIRPWP